MFVGNVRIIEQLNECSFVLVNESEPRKTLKRESPSVEQNIAVKRIRDEDVVTATDVSEMACGSDSHNSSIENKEEKPTEIEVKPDIFPNHHTDDGVYHFLMSLYDCMSELDPIRKVTVQARIYAMLSQEVAEAAKN